jgi:hypothetical protein
VKVHIEIVLNLKLVQERDPGTTLHTQQLIKISKNSIFIKKLLGGESSLRARYLPVRVKNLGEATLALMLFLIKTSTKTWAKESANLVINPHKKGSRPHQVALMKFTMMKGGTYTKQIS